MKPRGRRPSQSRQCGKQRRRGCCNERVRHKSFARFAAIAHRTTWTSSRKERCCRGRATLSTVGSDQLTAASVRVDERIPKSHLSEAAVIDLKTTYTKYKARGHPSSLLAGYSEHHGEVVPYHHGVSNGQNNPIPSCTGAFTLPSPRVGVVGMP